MEISRHTLNNEITKRVEEISGQNLFSCYQCGKCSAGCPVAPDLDILPNQVIRFLQIGDTEDAINSKTVWLCAACFTCLARCPKGIDVPAVMDALRYLQQEIKGEHLSPQNINDNILLNIPQQALVALARKMTR